MSASHEYQQEKEAIDAYIAKGFTVASVHESLDGALVTFRSSEGANESLPLLTADARKYLSTLIFIGLG